MGNQISGFEFTTSEHMNIISNNLPAKWNIHSSDSKVIGYSSDGSQMDNIVINFEGEGLIESVLLSDGCGCPLDINITVLPEEFILIIDEEKNVNKRADSFYQEVFLEYEISTQQNKLTLSPESLFLTHRELQTQLNKHVSLVLNSMNINNTAARTVHQLQFVDKTRLETQIEFQLRKLFQSFDQF